MLPVYNKPVVQYVVEEAMRGGVEDVIFVTNRDKGVIEDHFDYNLQLEGVLERAGKLEMLKVVRGVAEMVNIMSVRQKKQLGLGHAVLCAKEMVKGESFAVMVGDDFMSGEGIVMGEEITPGVYNITDMVEKPAVGTVDSRLAIVGRYVLTPDIFEHLERVKPGHGGEIQLTDALATLAKERGMLAVKMGGIRFDAGDWVDYLSANIYFGLRDEALCEPLKARLREMLG